MNQSLQIQRVPRIRNAGKRQLSIYLEPAEVEKIKDGCEKLHWTQNEYIGSALKIFNRLVSEKTMDEVIRLSK